MKNKLIFILWLLMFSFFSCDFGLKENEQTNSKEYFTVKGSCSIQGAIPSDLLPEKSIKQNAQRTVVPKIETDVITVIFESETWETKSVEVVNNDGVLNFEVELPAGKWTVKAQGKKSDVVIIKSESYQIELSAENKSANVALVLKPTQSDTGEGFFEFSFDMRTPKVSGMKYTYKKNGATESQPVIINDFSAKENIKLSSGVYTFRFDFYSDIDELLYSFTEVVNIFDELTTDTWITAGEYIDGGKICITDTMISQFVSTTVYVSEFGNDSNFGTFFAPVTTIQKAVDKIIAMNVVSASNEGNPYKILLLSDIETSSTDSFENNNNALVNIDLSSDSENPLYLTISKYGDGNATINANRSSYNTGRVMYIGENANVTLQNLILTGGYLLGENGGGIYSEGNCNLNSCTILGNTAKASSGSVSGGGVYINNSSTFTMTSGEISENSANYGGGVCVSGGTFIMEGGSISNNTADNNGGGVYVVKSNDTAPTFKISGNASITEDNDVYLTEDQKITIAGDLSSDIVARITPENYAENTKVLDAGDGITLNEEKVGQFIVTETDFFTSIITYEESLNEGFLKNTLKGTATLTKELYDICSTIKVNSAKGMNAISNLSQKNGEVDGKNFAGKTIILEDNVELGSDYELIKTFSGVFEGNSKTITLTIPDSYDSNKYFGGAIFNVITGKDAKVSDLNVYGDAYIAGIAIKLEDYAVISNCNNNANVTSPSVYGAAVPGCGGIVGELSNGGFIENCINTGTICYNSTNNNGCGGIVGVISSSNSETGNSIIANCINNGKIIREKKTDIVESNASIGGICGKVTGNAAIYNCVNTGDVTSEITNTSVPENIGGITGYCSVSFYEGEFPSLPANSIPDDMGIFNCYNSGTISSSSNSNLTYIGGIVGKGYVDFSNSVYHTIRVTNTVNNDDATFSVGNIDFSNNFVEFDITNNFYKSPSSSSKYPLEDTFDNNIDSVIKRLNEYSNENGYLKWKEDEDSGNIIFSEEISGN